MIRAGEAPILTNATKTPGERLVDLLDYIEQVVRLDERVAFRLADYVLPDRSVLSVPETELKTLPGLRLDGSDEDGPVWLAMERLARHDPPRPPDALAPWMRLDPDPKVRPAVVESRLETVSATERMLLLAADRAVEEDFDPVPERAEAADEPRFDRRLGLDDRLRTEVLAWIEGPWQVWATAEMPRRRAIGGLRPALPSAAAARHRRPRRRRRGGLGHRPGPVGAGRPGARPSADRVSGRAGTRS